MGGFGVPLLLTAGVACAHDQGIPVKENNTPIVTAVPSATIESKPTSTIAQQERSDLEEECELSLHQVKSGIVSPEDYLQERERCLPEVMEAKSAGILKGILYNPSDKELEKLLKDLFSKRTGDSKELEYLVQSSLDSYKSTKGKEAGAIVPGIIGVIGERIPSYVVFREELFSSLAINNDADMRSIIGHELQHVKDWYEGMSLNNTYLSYKTISPETFRIDFLEQLMELRAVYGELEDIFEERVKTASVSVSPQWFGSQAANYSKYWRFIEQYPTTDLERKVRELQIERFKGIIPEAKNDQILIKFDLFGKQEVAAIGKTP